MYTLSPSLCLFLSSSHAPTLSSLPLVTFYGLRTLQNWMDANNLSAIFSHFWLAHFAIISGIFDANKPVE